MLITLTPRIANKLIAHGAKGNISTFVIEHDGELQGKLVGVARNTVDIEYTDASLQRVTIGRFNKSDVKHKIAFGE
jgi:hypothetical protein